VQISSALSKLLALMALLLFSSRMTIGQEQRLNLEGMWSDPQPDLIDSLCGSACTDVGVDQLNALLDDPANDDRSYDELSDEAREAERTYLRSLLTAAALETFPLDPAADDRGFLYCEPWGVARQTTARHQLEIRDFGDHLTLRYGEWAAERTVYMDGREPPANAVPTGMGFSVGQYDSDGLVIETSGISANIISRPDRFQHSDQLRIVERYTKSDDGLRLLMTVSHEDPWALKEPFVLNKVWGWAPEETIHPEVDCERATEFQQRAGPL